MSSAVGILGCGWLGLPLAKTLLGNKYEVYGTTTSESKLKLLKQDGIRAFMVQLGAGAIRGELSEFLHPLDVLVVNVPPKLRSDPQESYIEKMQLLYNHIKAVSLKKVIFVSSTSVYGDTDGVVTEDTAPEPLTNSGKQLLASELLFWEDPELQTTIVRYGGLIGADRHPIHRLSGKKGLTNGNAPVNLIHLNDAVRLLELILENEYWGEVFNGVYPDHPSKRDYYKREALKRGLEAPDYVSMEFEKRGKIVKSKNFLDKKQSFLTPISS